jgi:HEAT repeat protein
MTRSTALVVASLLLSGAGFVAAQPAPVDGQALQAAIDQLGDFDYETRTAASRLVRRAPTEQASPALAAAVTGHDDGYVRFRALVLLVGFGGPAAKQVVLDVLDDPNDRLRAVAYGYFAHDPDPAMAPRLLQALDTETSEFVRPALIRAVAAHDDDAAVRARLTADIDRGQDFFRGGVIEALADRGAGYAVNALMRIVAEPGPLQDDALLALTRIGDPRALASVAALQGKDEQMEPMVSAAAAVLGSDRNEHFQFVSESLRFAAAGDDADVVRSAAAGLGAIASGGDADAVQVLFDVAINADQGPREAVALVLGMLAMRNSAVVLGHLETRSDLPAAALVLRDGFDMLDEDLDEERFFMTARTEFWAAPEGSRSRAVTEELIKVLEF